MTIHLPFTLQHWEPHLYEVITVLQVDDDGHVQVLVPSGERQGASCHTVAHAGVLRQGFAQVSSGFWVLATEGDISRVTNRDPPYMIS